MFGIPKTKHRLHRPLGKPTSDVVCITAMGRLRLTERLTKLLRLSWADWGLLLEATLWLGLARAALVALPFRWLARHLGRLMAESPPAGDPAFRPQLARVSWAVREMSRYTPWRSACLAQALAAKGMLRRRGIASTLYLGLAKENQSALIAHAWLRSGSMILTGGQGRSRYTVVATFADSHASE